MNRVLRIGLAVLALFVIIVAVLAFMGWRAVKRPFPTTDGNLSLLGLQDEVIVYRDEMGVPHIFANNEHDLFMAQGYVHAQDRFWQMEFWRHVGQGRISELIGPPGIESDKFIRTLGWNRIAADTLALYEAEEPEIMASLNAYSSGVNAYIEQNRRSLSVNHTILGLVNEPWEIEPWEPLHTVGWSVVMADDLSGSWNREIRNARLITEFGQDTFDTLLSRYPYGSRPVIAPTDQHVGKLDSGTTKTNEMATLYAGINWEQIEATLIGDYPEDGYLGAGEFVGSNNWVIAGEHTSTGLPLLANDPHLGIQMPAIWYEVGLHAPTYEVVGMSFAGTPGVVIGHNSRIAWGVTNVAPDVRDLYIEKLNPDNPDQYEFEGEWLEVTQIEETIRVNGGEEITLPVRLTHHGPIINELTESQDEVLSIRWTAQEPNRIIKSIFALNRALTYEEFREALRFWDVPSQNFVFADTRGNIAYQMPGLIPIRPSSDGLTPVPGWTGEHEWQGWVPYEELPALLNPEQGFIVTANHAVVDKDYPYFINHYWADGDRGQRIEDMIAGAIENKRPLSIEDVARMQFDSYSLMAAKYVPLLANLQSEDAQINAAIAELNGWNYQLRRDSVPAALFEIFYMQLVRAVIADEIGPETFSDLHSTVFMHALARQPEADWWDNISTDAIETREDILLRALNRTIRWFEENQGGDMGDWTWGDIHTATFVSQPLGQSGTTQLEQLVNLGPLPADGGNSIVNSNSWSWSNPAAVRSHVSMRLIINMADFDTSRAIIPTGQSGHPTHPNYSSMNPLWLNGQNYPLLWSRDAIKENATDTLFLTP